MGSGPLIKTDRFNWTQPRSWGVAFALASLIAIVAWKGVVPAFTTVNSDFSNYYVSAKLMARGYSVKDFYDNEWFKTKAMELGAPAPGKFAPFPPLTACLMIPLVPFELLTAQRIFLFVNLAVLFFTIRLTAKTLGTSWQSALMFVLCAGWAVINNIAFGQVYLMITALLLFAYRADQTKSHTASAFALAFFTVIKYITVVFAASVFIDNASGKKRAHFWLLTFVASLVGLLLLQVSLFGVEVTASFLQSTFLPHLDGRLRGQNEFSYFFQSWDSLFRNVFLYHAEFNTHPFMPWPAGRWIAKGLVYAAVLLSLCAVVWRFRNAQAEERRPVYFAVPMLAMLVVLPAAATYHFIILVFALALLLGSSVLSRNSKLVLFLTYTAIGFIPYSVFFIMSERWGLAFAYPRLMLISLLYTTTCVELLSKVNVPRRSDLVKEIL